MRFMSFEVRGSGFEATSLMDDISGKKQGSFAMF